MAKEYDNSNSGALFKNKDKTAENPTWPDYNGSLQTTCGHCGRETHFWLSAWLKVAKQGALKGKSFMSVATEQKEKQASAPPPQHAPPQQEGFDDDIPF